MAFPQTITLTLNAVPKVLNRLNQDNFGSYYTYKGPTEEIRMQIRHSVDSVDKKTGLVNDRHNVFVEHTIYATPVAAVKYSSFTGTIRQGNAQDILLGQYLSAAVVDWLDTAGVIPDLVAGIN